MASYVPVLVPKHLVFGVGSQELSGERYSRRPPTPDSTHEQSQRPPIEPRPYSSSGEPFESPEDDAGAPRVRFVYARQPARRPAALWIPRASRGADPPLSTTHWRGMDQPDANESPAGALIRQRRSAAAAPAKPLAARTAASGFIPIAGPFGGQELAYSAFLDGGSSTPFPAGFSSYASPSRQQRAKQAYGGGFDYGRSTTSAFSAGSLGSGNFQLIRGGVYADDQASSRHVPYYVQGPSSGYQAYSFDEDDGGPVLGFQGFEHFGSPLHNALSKHSHVVGASTEHRTHTSTPAANEDHMRATE